MLSVQQALDRLLSRAAPALPSEPVGTLAASGRVLAESLRAPLDLPPVDNAAMDGFAVRARDCAPGLRLPVSQRIAAGCRPGALAPGSAARIFTGAPMPPGADAVVMQECCRLDGDGLAVTLLHQPAPGEHLRRAGEDVRAGSVLLEAGALLRPQEVACAAAAGLAMLPVARRVRVAMLCTGDELAQPGQPLAPGQVYNANRYALGALLTRLGCETSDYGVVHDRLDATRAALRDAAACHDLILTSGGASVGEEDHVRAAVGAEGEIDCWKIAVKPGKPLAFGAVRRADGTRAHFIGLPGNPVAAFVAFLMFVRPFVLRLQGAREVLPRPLQLRAGFAVAHPDQRLEFLRARLAADGGLELVPGGQGSALLCALSQADGLVLRAPGQVIRPGDPVSYLPFGGLLP